MAGDLVTFLRARLDTDEAEAGALHRRGDSTPLTRSFAARMLREVEAKRAILEQWKGLHPVAESLMQEQQHGVYAGDGEYTLGAYAALTKTMRHLAAVYSDHPDYDPGWGP